MINIPNEIKNLLLLDGTRKNIRIKFPNGERDDICNDSIVQNSVKFTESLCSQDELRFGLCESSVFECELVGIGNIKGMSIFAQMEIDCSSLGETWCDENAQTSEDVDYPFYVLPYGSFIINSCQKQADMSHRKLVAYSVEIGNTLNETQNQLLFEKLSLEQQSAPSITTYSFNPYMLAMALYGKGKNDALTYDREIDIYDTGNEATVYSNLTYSVKVKSGFSTVRFTSTTQNEFKLVYKEMPTVSDDVLDEIYENLIVYVPLISKKTIKNIFGELKNRRYIFYQNILGDTFPIPFYVSFTYKITCYSGNTAVYTKQFRNLEDCHLYDCDVPISNAISIPKSYSQNEVGDTTAYVEFPNLKDVLEGCIEAGGYFGKFARNGNFDLVAPSSISNLYPSETLYPSNNLFPQGMKGYSVPSTYSNAWYDDELSLPYGRVQAEYTYSWTESSKEKTEQRIMYLDLVDDYEDNPDKYQIYDFSDNYIIKNSKYTSSTVSNVSEMINNIASKISQIRYMPCDIDGIGMPWLEAGDTIALETTDGDLLKTIILSRTLSGEQYLTDNLSSN